jgi:hypothetical protein
VVGDSIVEPRQRLYERIFAGKPAAGGALAYLDARIMIMNVKSTMPMAERDR